MKNTNEHFDRRMENIRLRKQKTRRKFTWLFIQVVIIILLWSLISSTTSYKEKIQIKEVTDELTTESVEETEEIEEIIVSDEGITEESVSDTEN